MAQVETSVKFPQILQILNWSNHKFFRNRQELIDAGVIFYQYSGRPPKRRIMAFPSRIQNWIALKAQKGEMV